MNKQIKETQAFDPTNLDFSKLVGNLQSREVSKIDLTRSERETDEFQAWIAQRLGKITGSQFGKVKKQIIARGGRKKGDWSGTADTYMREIIGEHLTGKQSKDFTAKATQWGIEHEKEAIEYYQKLRGVKVYPAGFIKMTKKIGCTVDGFLVDEKGCIEVKCPWNTANHIENIEENTVPSEYWEQVLGHILVTKTEYCDFISYDPRCKEPFKMHIIRIERKDFVHEIEELRNNLLEFEALLIAKLKKLFTKNKLD
jgi:hypothetical protein